MSDEDLKSNCSSTELLFESSLISKPTASDSESTYSTLTRPSSSELLYNFVNYDPFSHRSRSHHSSYSAIAIFIWRSIGLGFLCMPYAFQQVGVFTGMLLCMLAGISFSYSYTLLCRFRYKLCQIHRVPTVPYYSYQNLIECSLTLGPRAISCYSTFFRYLFIIMNLALNFGTSCLYVKFVTLIIQELFKDTMDITMSMVEACLIYTVPCFAFLLIPSPKYLEPSTRIVNHVVCTVILCYFLRNMMRLDIQINSRSLIRGDWTDIYQFIGILLFSFVPVVQSLKIEDDLIQPEDFVGRWYGLLNISLVIVTNVYITIGLWGYLAHQNLPKIGYSVLAIMPINRTSNIIKLCFAGHIALIHQELCSDSVLLWSTSFAAAAVAEIKRDNKMHKNQSTEKSSPSALAYVMAATKIVFTCCSFLVAIVFLSPSSDNRRSLEKMMALTGYVGNAWNILIYPYVIELCLTHATHGMSARPFVIAKDIFFIILGLTTFTCGTYRVLVRIINSHNQ